MRNTDFLYFEELDSTNTYAMKNLHHLNDRQIILASKQTAGRGRLQRKWVSDVVGNIYMSIILKPHHSINNDLPLSNITQYMSVVLAELIKEYGILPQIKWPNDVLVDGAKIAGILSEASIQGSTLKGFVLGIGVNLNCSQADLESIDQKATSLNLLLNKPIDRDSFAHKLVTKFFERYDEFLSKGFCCIKEDYIKLNSFLGKNIEIKALTSNTKGIAHKVNDDGTLLLINENNEECIITMGDLICL